MYAASRHSDGESPPTRGSGTTFASGSGDVESVARDGVVVMLSKEPVARRPHLGPPVVTHSGESGCGKGLRQTESVEIYAEEYRPYAGGI